MEHQDLDSVGGGDVPSVQGFVSTDEGNDDQRSSSVEVVPKARRRRFSAAYKLRVLDEVDQSPEQTGVVLRREGLYLSHLSTWRKDRREGSLKALATKPPRPEGEGLGRPLRRGR